MKLFGKCISALLILLLFGSFILWVLAKNINPETIKQLVCDQISSMTHKKSKINGDVSWHLLPRPGLKLTKMQIGEEQGNENYSATVNTVYINLQITPLLRGNFVFNELLIDGIKLQINKDAPQTSASQEISTTTNNSYFNKVTQQFAIQKFALTHGELVINKNGQHTVFKNIQAAVEQFNMQKTPFPIQIKARLTESALFSTTKANINFKGRLRLASTVLSELQDELGSSSAEGQLSLQNVLLNQFAIKKVNATLKTRKGKILLNPLTMSLYNGQSIGDLEYTVSNQQIALNQSATKLNGKKFLSDLSTHDLISGLLDYSIHAQLSLNKISLDAITGSGTITIKDGELTRLNLNQLVNKLKTMLDGLAAAPKKLLQIADWNRTQPVAGGTPFKLASMDYKLNEGFLTSSGSILQTEQLQVTSEGSLNLTTQDIKARLKITLNTNNMDNSLQKIQNNLGGSFPFVISGTLEDPIAEPDFKLLNVYIGRLISVIPLKQPVRQIGNTLNALKEIIR